MQKERNLELLYMHFICDVYLTDVADGELFGWGEEEREALVFSGELVGVVYTVVAGGAEGGLVRRAKHRRLVFVTDVALDLHLGFQL